LPNRTMGIEHALARRALAVIAATVAVGVGRCPVWYAATIIGVRTSRIHAQVIQAIARFCALRAVGQFFHTCSIAPTAATIGVCRARNSVHRAGTNAACAASATALAAGSAADVWPTTSAAVLRGAS
jgi:hypothetical protein